MPVFSSHIQNRIYTNIPRNVRQLASLLPAKRPKLDHLRPKRLVVAVPQRRPHRDQRSLHHLFGRRPGSYSKPLYAITFEVYPKPNIHKHTEKCSPASELASRKWPYVRSPVTRTFGGSNHTAAPTPRSAFPQVSQRTSSRN